jgi:MFS transporter, SHS family, sialic acid transporter
MNDASPPPTLSRTGCWLVLTVAFLGWFFAGVHMAITSVVMRVAVADLLPPATGEGEIGKWFGWMVCAFLFGAAAGGYVFGYVGDRIGRAKAMAASILCYSVFSGLAYYADNAESLLVLRFLTCMGVGGIWPNGVALLAEAWPDVSRPFLAGLIGTAANVGITLFAVLTIPWQVTVDDWRWTMLAGASPVVLGIFGWFAVPESPRWLSLRRREAEAAEEVAEVGAQRNPVESRDRGFPSVQPRPPIKSQSPAGLMEIFRPPLLRITLIGILLGTVPLFGGWGVSNWANAWASEAGDKPASGDKTNAAKAEAPDPALKSWATIARGLPGSISSLLGGALAFYLGRKRTYFLLSLGALVCTQLLFRVDDPHAPEFLFWMGALGFFSGFFFGWLPLCLPELFPTRVRSTGAGVSFNWGRILTGIGVLASAVALKDAFQGEYALVGRVTGFVYALGMVVILFAPESAAEEL